MTTAASDSPRVVEVELSIRGSHYPPIALTRSEGWRVELAEMVPRQNGRCAEFLNVTNADPDRVIALMADDDSLQPTLLREHAHGGLFECVVSDRCPAWELAALGALPREATAVDGEARIVAEIPPRYDAAAIVETFLEETPGAALEAKHEKASVAPLFDRAAFQQVFRQELTPRQREVLETAYRAGYYEWPRESTGGDVAAELGITSATFSEHIHTAERKLLAMLFDRRGRDE